MAEQEPPHSLAGSRACSEEAEPEEGPEGPSAELLGWDFSSSRVASSVELEEVEKEAEELVGSSEEEPSEEAEPEPEEG